MSRKSATRERPIIFSGEMVRALLDGRKTQTRRIVRGLPNDAVNVRVVGGRVKFGSYDDASTAFGRIDCPYGDIGDRLWVRETHAQFAVGNRSGTSPQCVAYRATCDANGGFDYVNNGDEVMHLKVTKWTPAIHMPRWASRIDLEITAVRVERLQAISEEDARAEGFTEVRFGFNDIKPRFISAKESLSLAWDALNEWIAPWKSNPWVWALTFKRVRQ